ncbi:hypothetical protein JHK87_019455 [Glycine soja]|nr:hypothetical protein JHK87_019455 [Glycine soja]
MLDKRHNLDKRQPLPKEPRYEHYTPLTVNCTTILKESFNLKVPIRLPSTKPPRSGGKTPQVKQPTPRLIGKTFNQGQVKYTPHIRGESSTKQKEVPPNG